MFTWYVDDKLLPVSPSFKYLGRLGLIFHQSGDMEPAFRRPLQNGNGAKASLISIFKGKRAKESPVSISVASFTDHGGVCEWWLFLEEASCGNRSRVEPLSAIAVSEGSLLRRPNFASQGRTSLRSLVWVLWNVSGDERFLQECLGRQPC